MTIEGSPPLRQRKITEWLQEHQTMSIGELSKRLNVSGMTVHRDIKTLAEQGVVRKVRGGVEFLLQPESSSGCALCSMNIPNRTALTIQQNDNTQIEACCPHCGLLFLQDLPDVKAVLMRDFLYGRMINAQAAIYLVGSNVSVCCMPSVLCFASRDDATKFGQGFGGEIMSLVEAQTYLATDHHTCHDN